MKRLYFILGLTLLAGLSSCNTKKPEEQAKEVQMMKDSIVQATKDSLIAANKKDSIAKAEALAQRAQAEHEAQAEKIILHIEDVEEACFRLRCRIRQ